MPRQSSHQAPGDRPTWAGPALVVLVAVLAAAFLGLPARLAGLRGPRFGGEQALASAFRTDFLQFWRSGGTISTDLDELLSYWVLYHLAKALVAGLLLVALVTMSAHLRRRIARPQPAPEARRLAHRAALAASVLASFCAWLLVMANIQGAVAPFSSLVSMLPGPATSPIAGALSQVSRQITDYPTSSSTAVDVMVADFSRYHLALALLAGLATFVLAITTHSAWRRSRSLGRSRPQALTAALPSALGTTALATLLTANAATAINPAPALAAFFAGSL